MKKNLHFFILALFASFLSQAQLGGVYTINSAVVTGGNNFQTFAAFKTALIGGGVTGTVVVNVVANSGPYNEQVDFPNVASVNATNTITINGNGNTMSFAGNGTSPWTIGMSGIDYMTINDMVFVGTGAQALVCKVWGQSNNNAFNNCTFNCPPQGVSTLQVPVSLSGSGTSATTQGNGGNNNVWTNCNMNWGYYGVVFYTSTSAPFNTGNCLYNCTVRDFYAYGVYNYYHRDFTIRGNIIERPQRNTSTTGAGIYLTTQSYKATIEKNKIRRLWEAYPGYTGTSYGIFCVASVSGSVTVIRNNVVSNFENFPGTLYGIYLSTGNYTDTEHNTVSLDDISNIGSSTTYGIFATGGGTQQRMRNNNVSIRRTGSGTKYCLYMSTTNHQANYNNLYINSPSGTNYVGYYGGTSHLTQVALAGAGSNVNGWSFDPFFASPATYFYMPTQVAINNMGTALGVVDDVDGNPRSMTTPDPGAYEYFNTPCAGSPGANTVVIPTSIICPNTSINVGLMNSYTVSGMTYQWQYSNVSSVGPWTPVPSGSNPAITPTVGNVPLYYSAVITCTNSSNNITVASNSVNVAGTVTNSIPYLENFEGILAPGKLPNCDWSANNMNATCLTYTNAMNQNRSARSGTKFGAFYYSPVMNNSFWTNQIWMDAGVNYSITMWYQTEYYTYPTWELRLWVSAGQTTVGAQQVAGTGGSGTAASPSYKSLSNTYSVTTSGFYYVGVNGESNGTCCGTYLSWDDLEIIVPCQLNQPAISVSANNTVVCAGQSVVLTANGADTYLWNTGATTSVITVVPGAGANYAVIGTNAGSGCSANAFQAIQVNPAPMVSIFAPATAVCPGTQIYLTATGAQSYQWSNNANTSIISVTPAANVSYQVIGTTSLGCTGTANQAISVHAAPTVSIASSNSANLACEEDVTELSYSGAGGVSFQWLSSNGLFAGNPVNVSPNMTTSYTLIATSAQGCTNQAAYELFVTICTGIDQQFAGSSAIVVYPNPGKDIFYLEGAAGVAKTIEISDLTGRVVRSLSSGENVVGINLADLANGVYLAKVNSNGVTNLIKIIKE